MSEIQGPRGAAHRLAVWRVTRPVRTGSKGDGLGRRTAELPAGIFWGLPR